MPINNSINKNSDTFFATSNITANFTSPVLTTSTSAITFTNVYSAILQSTNRAAFSTEYYGVQSASDGNASTIVLQRGTGSKASPGAISGIGTANNVLIGQIRFEKFGLSNSAAMVISAYGAANTGGLLQFTNSFSSSGGFRIADNGTTFQNSTHNIAEGIDFLPTNIPFPTGYNSAFISKSGGTFDGRLRVVTQGSSTMGVTVQNCQDASVNGGSLFLTRSRGTTTAPANVQLNDVLGSINFAGRQSTNNFNRISSYIEGAVDGTLGSLIVPGRLVFFTSNTSGTLLEAMRIDSAQRVTQPLQPSFSVSLSGDVTNATGDGTGFVVPFDVELYDQGGNFSANTFTAPIAGRYRFCWTISVFNLSVGHTRMEVSVNNIVCRCNPYAIADSLGFCLLNGSIDLSLAASATVTMVVTVSGSTKTVSIKGTTSSGTFLSGQLQV